MLCYLTLLEHKKDETDFIQLYQHSYSYLFQVGISFLHDPYQAEDAIHETFLKAAKNFSKILSLPRDKQVAYLVIIMKNQCRDMLRKNKNHLPLPDSEDAFPFGAGPDLWEKGQETCSVYQRAVEIIHSMDDSLEAVLTSRLVEERTNGQTARLLGISKDAASRRYLRGLEILHKTLKEEGYEYEG